MLKFVITLFFLLFVVGVIANQIAPKSVTSFTIHSPELGYEKKIWVYLPKGYETSRIKYPVMYLHDGQSVFDTKISFYESWEVEKTLNAINAKVIVVAVSHNGEKRIDELTPFPHLKYGGGKAKDYMDFIVNTVKPKIDKKYRTKVKAKHTAILGSSLGGLASFYASLEYSNTFGKIGCFSPSFWFNRKEINSLLKEKTMYSQRIFFLCGDTEGDDDVIPDMLNIVNWVKEKQKDKINYKSVIVKEGKHNEKLWRENFKDAYLWLYKIKNVN